MFRFYPPSPVCIFVQPSLLSFLTASAFGVPPSPLPVQTSYVHALLPPLCILLIIFSFDFRLLTRSDRLVGCITPLKFNSISGVQEEGGAADGGRELRVALPGQGADVSLEPHGVPGDVQIRTGDTLYLSQNVNLFETPFMNAGGSRSEGVWLPLELLENSCHTLWSII